MAPASHATSIAAAGIELLTPQEMAEADQAAIAAGTPGITLMERAGAAVALAARAMWRGGRVVVLAGPGNNGGDGFVAARLLREAGYRVTVALYGERGRLQGDAGEAAASFEGVVEAASAASFQGAGLIVDALYGAGVRLPLSPVALALIRAANASGAPVLAVDLPSGIDGATGGLAGDAIRAGRTVTFFRAKPGHVLLPGRLHCGEVSVADIGIPDAVLGGIGVRTMLNRPALWLSQMRWPGPDSHKYRRGHVVVVSGPAAATGAARLAARAALRIGAGIVRVASPASAVAENAGQLTAVMVREADSPAALRRLLSERRVEAVVIGPGLGTSDDGREKVEAVLESEAAVVLDADALSGFADNPQRLLDAIASRGPTVLTPHDGEFARLFPDIAGTGVSRLHRARAAAERAGAVVLLKGADTVVAAPDGRSAIADNAPPALATAGAGDVLAGMLGGLLAQGMPAFEAACAAVWLHGDAASRVGPGLIAEDLEGVLAAALQDLRRHNSVAVDAADQRLPGA